jgi:hypothetical protein
MPNQDDLDGHNDGQLLTPLLLMAVIIAVGSLIFAFM